MNRIISSWHNVSPYSHGNLPDYATLTNLDLTSLGQPFQSLIHWSNLVLAEGDKRLEADKGKSYTGALGWIKKDIFWEKKVVLQIVGDPYAEYVVGYYSAPCSECKVSNQRRFTWLGDNTFAMRVGPDDCGFFVVSDVLSGPLELRHCGYVTKDMDLL